jgi:DmsE family decaheme c-type cytochrome
MLIMQAMNRVRIVPLLLLLAVLHAPAAVIADDADSPLPEVVEACLMCHDDPAVKGILHGPHAVLADPRTGFAEQGCASCHGPSQAHMQRPPRGSPRAPPDRHFGRDAANDPREQDAACLDCHRGSAGLHWTASAHEREGITCVDCHRVHDSDPMQDSRRQTDACSSCHRKTAAEFRRPSVHPLLDGRMDCSDCHAPHGSAGPASLTRPTANETCFECHAEMRGPFLWEHPPAREDCSNCHRPHGAVHRPLLTQRPPWLCQQCHMAQFHPSTALSGSGLPGETLPSGSTSLLGRNCMNCHAQVHGSNHPSGAGFTR